MTRKRNSNNERTDRKNAHKQEIEGIDTTGSSTGVKSYYGYSRALRVGAVLNLPSSEISPPPDLAMVSQADNTDSGPC